MKKQSEHSEQKTVATKKKNPENPEKSGVIGKNYKKSGKKKKKDIEEPYFSPYRFGFRQWLYIY